MMTGLLWAVAILLAMGWFAIGWVARGSDNRRYAESRDRHFERLAHTQAVELEQARWVYRESERIHPAPTPQVVYVPVPSPMVPMWPSPTYPAVDGPSAPRELPGVQG